MSRRFLQVAIFAFWAAMTGWFIRYEAYPAYFAGTFSGYTSLFRDAPLLLDTWMKITFQNAPIGYSHTLVESADGAPGQQFLVHNETQLSLNILGESQRLIVITRAGLDSGYRLQDFRFSVESRRYSAEISGKRTGGDRFEVRINTGASQHTIALSIPDDVILYSPMTDMALSRLQPGQEQRIRTLDPSSLSFVDVVAKAIRRERIARHTNQVETLLLELDYNGMKMQSWVDAAGQVLRQETPFGWVMEQCSAEVAVDLDYDASPSADLLTALAVPCTGAVEFPRRARKLKLRLTGAPLTGFHLDSARQNVLAQDGDGTDLVLSHQEFPEPGQPMTNTMRPEDLRATPFLQADDPAILRQARAIIKDSPDANASARAIGSWVYRNVEKNPAASLPSALEVLRVREGDCNEHTYLFVALARAAGIPARIKVGLLFLDGAFYYHAWPAVFVGEWIEMDPTLGQDTVDATHLALLEGELADQLKLMGVVGRLKAEVLEVTYD